MSKFDDDMARGCLPTGEPLECLYGVGWWTEHDEPEPDPYDLHIAELESRIAGLEHRNKVLEDACEMLRKENGRLTQRLDFWKGLSTNGRKVQE